MWMTNTSTHILGSVWYPLVPSSFVPNLLEPTRRRTTPAADPLARLAADEQLPLCLRSTNPLATKFGLATSHFTRPNDPNDVRPTAHNPEMSTVDLTLDCSFRTLIPSNQRMTSIVTLDRPRDRCSDTSKTSWPLYYLPSTPHELTSTLNARHASFSVQIRR